MDKVLSLAERLEERKRKEQIEAYREKYEAVQRTVQCSACHFKCAMCGRHVEEPPAPNQKRHLEGVRLNLCESCGSEFDDFERACGGEKSKTRIFWHNKEWISLWETWVRYQQALEEFRRSFHVQRRKENRGGEPAA